MAGTELTLHIWISLLHTSKCEEDCDCFQWSIWIMLIRIHLHSAYASSSQANCNVCPVLDLKRSKWKKPLHLTANRNKRHQCQHPCHPGYGAHHLTREDVCTVAILRRSISAGQTWIKVRSRSILSFNRNEQRKEMSLGLQLQREKWNEQWINSHYLEYSNVCVRVIMGAKWGQPCHNCILLGQKGLTGFSVVWPFVFST